MLKPKHHLLDVYAAHLWLATTPKQWRYLVRRFELEDDSATGSLGATQPVLDTETYEYHLLVWVDLKAHTGDALQVVTTCAHEAAHAATMLLIHLGHEIQHADEPHAYLVGWITRWLVEQIEWTPA